jgi:tripartite-type tricarboxylate transporter receptor subunit TctC
LFSVVLSVAIVALAVGSSRADPVEDFYRGKQVRFITAYSAGGLFDTATRIFGRHIGKFIPGKPNVWVDNMTGAGGLIATNYLANSAPRDGSVLLNLDGALLRLQALANPAAKFDARRFNWLPSPGPDIQVCWVGKQSSWHSITEAFSGSKELKMGGLAPGTFPSDNARALQAALGINLKIIDGFKGVTEIRLATESGEWTDPALPMKASFVRFQTSSRLATSESSRKSARNRGRVWKTCPMLSIWPRASGANGCSESQ